MEDLSAGEAVSACAAATMARRLLPARSRLVDEVMPHAGAQALAYAR